MIRTRTPAISVPVPRVDANLPVMPGGSSVIVVDVVSGMVDDVVYAKTVVVVEDEDVDEDVVEDVTVTDVVVEEDVVDVEVVVRHVLSSHTCPSGHPHLSQRSTRPLVE